MSRSSSSRPDEGWVEWATTGRPHGLQGELRLFLHNPGSDRLDAVDRVRLVGNDERLDTRIRRLRGGPKSAIATFEGVADRNAAELWKNCRVLVPADTFPELDDDTWYAFELEGLVAITADGTAIGTVETVTDFGAGDLLVVRRGSDVEFLPFAEPYVGAIDTEAGTIVVQLLDLED